VRVPMKGLGVTRPVSPSVIYCTCNDTGVNKHKQGTRNVVRGVQTRTEYPILRKVRRKVTSGQCLVTNFHVRYDLGLISAELGIS
jgi:hypothetical protein